MNRSRNFCRFAATLFCTAAMSLTLAGCASLPGLGGLPGGEASAQAGAPITQAERSQGSQANPELIAEFGGAVSGPQATYVEGIGKNIAVQSGLGNARTDFNVTLLNSSVNNAFAIPGGYIYVTRQLVGLMNNEAELAGVLGHEVGHVAARHSAQRQNAATRNSVLGAIGQILSGVLLGDSALGRFGQQVASTAPQLATLSFSRNQELEADALGIQYLKSAGYDPRAMGTVLADLAAQNNLEAAVQGRDSAKLPEWASTHPDPASRVQGALQRAGTNATGVTNRDTFLTRIDGIMYGDDPKQGIIEGRTFTHPTYRLQFTAPQGFYLTNGTRAVSINGSSGQGQLSTAAYNGNLDTYIRQVFTSIGGDQQLAPSSIQKTTVNGLPAAYGTARVNSGNGTVDLVIFAYQFSNSQAFHFATISQSGKSGNFTQMFNSMKRISVAEANAITPRRIDVVTVKGGDTVQSLARRMAYSTAQIERFRVLNGLRTNDKVQAGQRVKLVVNSAN